MVGVHRLVGQIMLSPRLAGPLHMTGLRVSTTDTFMASAVVPLDLLCPLFTALAGAFL